MGVYFIGCLHLGHESLARHRGFRNSEEHDAFLIQEWNKIVNKKDKIFILGDITMERSIYYQLDLLKGYKHVVGGNHDLGHHTKTMLEYVDKFSGAVNYRRYLLTHVPVHPNEVHFYKANIHAHIHHENKLEEAIVHDSYADKDSRPLPTKHKYINVDAKLLNYKPISFEQIKEIMDS